MIFEAERYRVHTTAKAAWVEIKESESWVFREQRSIPVPAELLEDAAETSMLKAAVSEFESSRAGDTSLRAALTGASETKKRPIVKERPRMTAKPSIVQETPIIPKRQSWRQPLRPPLRPSNETRTESESTGH